MSHPRSDEGAAGRGQGYAGSSQDAEAFTLDARARSFGYAFAGIAALLRTQHNAWIHAAASLAVVAAGLWLGLGAAEWYALLLAMALVWTAEALNTAIELLADAVSPDHNSMVGRAKDVAAGAVLLASLGAAAVGLIVFVPRILVRLGMSAG